MVFAAFTNSDVFQVAYPLLTIPLAAWYGRVTERRVAAAPLVQVLVGGPFQQLAPQPQPVPAAPAQPRVIREKVVYRAKKGDDDDWWVAPLGIVIAGLVVALLVPRGYSAARGTLLDILLGGGVVALGITAGTYVGLRKLSTFTGGFRASLGGAALTELLAILNAYLLLHPSWTRGGSYEQAFDSFLRLGPDFSDAFSAEHSHVTFFLAYQGIGAVVAILALAVALLCTFSISAQVERNAGAHLGPARRLVVWTLDRLGGGQWLVVPGVFAAVVAAAFCSGVLYNLVRKSSFELPAAKPVVTGLHVEHTRSKVAVRFRLDERATVTVLVRRVQRGHAGPPLNHTSARLAPGLRRITIPARTDRRALRKGVYQVRVRARATSGEVSAPRTVAFRVE
jgi:hypothetical protein